MMILDEELFEGRVDELLGELEGEFFEKAAGGKLEGPPDSSGGGAKKGPGSLAKIFFGSLRSGGLYPAAYLYLALPTLIFALGWLKPVFAVALGALVACSIWLMSKRAREAGLQRSRKKRIEWKYLAAFGIILFWVAISGVGRFSYQSGDHYVKNGSFEELVTEKWPVVYEAPEAFSNQPVGVVYYIGFWLPSALVGKAFGLEAGYAFQALWAALGIYLFYRIVTEKFAKKPVLWPLMVIIFFSGLDAAGEYLVSGESLKTILTGGTEHMEWWMGFPRFQYSSMTTQLFWVFNQAVPAWLCTAAMIAQKDNRSIAMLVGLSMITGVFPAIGLAMLALFMLGRAAAGTIRSENPYPRKIRGFIGEHITLENCAGLLVAGVYAVYFMGNMSGQGGRFREWNTFAGLLISVLVFFAVEAGVYLAAIARDNKKNYLFYYVIVSLLLVCPWYCLGAYNDFCMRASIPALAVLVCLVIGAMAKAMRKKRRGALAVLIGLLVIGAATPMREIVVSVKETVRAETDGGSQYKETMAPMDFWGRDQYYGYTDNAFFKWLAR